MKKSPATPTAAIGRVIATRELTDAKVRRKRITVSLGVPHRIREGRWDCPFSIEGLSSGLISERSPGGDSLSALLYAADDVRRHLMETGTTFEWNGDSELGGDTGGIPRFLPLGMGKEFYDRVDSAINREIERTVRLRHKDARQKWRAESKPSRPFHPRIGRIVASRELTDAKNPERRIVVALGLPRQVDSMEWECKLHIDGLEPIMHYISGVDSMQALLLGVEALRLSLKRSPHRLAWLGDSTFYPNGGLPQQVGGNLGEEFDERIEQLIEREKQPFWEAHLKYLGDRRREYLRSRDLEARKQSSNSGEKPSSKGRRRSD